MGVQKKPDDARAAVASRRRYVMRERRARLDETRDRIAQAAFELHATVGPARTSISAIAERAGVQRHTVYHHFPDLVALVRACTAHGIRVTHPPDPDGYGADEPPAQRLRRALADQYAYFDQNERLVANLTRDLPRSPDLLEGSAEFFQRVGRLHEAVAAGWATDPEQTRRVGAAIAHAFDFGTWRSLRTSGLGDAEVLEAMTAFVALMAAGVSDGSEGDLAARVTEDNR
jgi:AcrR family transcriptional regulator